MTNTSNEPDQPSEGGTRSEDEEEQGYITDDQLPEDLRPDDDNPLAQNPDEEGHEDTEEGAPKN